VFTNLAREYGLDQAGAQKMIDLHLAVAETVQKNAQEQFEQQAAAEAQAWREQIQKDPELGGARLPQTQQLVDAFQTSVLEVIGIKSSDFVQALGNRAVHPVLVQMMAKLGKMVSEDPVNMAGSGGGESGETAAQRMYANSGMR